MKNKLLKKPLSCQLNQTKRKGKVIIKDLIVITTLICLLLNISACKTGKTNESMIESTFSNSKDNTSSTKSRDITSDADINLKLEDYAPPKDGVDYDSTPLELNKPLNFITRREDKLYDGEKELRFISANAPTALDSSPFEQEDIIKTIAQMGGQIVRTYTFSIRTKYQNDSVQTYITGKNQYNEIAFKRLDNLLALANKYGVRLIIPFIDPYTYNGGIPSFLDMYGITPTNNVNTDNGVFYSNDDVEKGFLDFVSYVLNRKNTITGIFYKDDPAILAWETGNELQGPMPKYNLWIRDLCAQIKMSDTKHLILDGWFGVRPQAIADPNIDIVSHHFYPQIVSKAYPEELNTLMNITKGKKPLVIGEFGFIDPPEIKAFYDEIIKSGACGSLIWSIRNHDEKGGFWQHKENEKYGSYHWPGFTQGSEYDEIEVLKLTYLKAYEIQNKKPKLIAKPSVPQIIEPINNPQTQIKWKGSTGAYGYDFQRADQLDGEWATIGVNISDDFMFATSMFKDKSKDLATGKKYYYRIRSRSVGGYSDWSKPVEAAIIGNK